VPRYISFMLTQPQIRARTKTVTRRVGWKDLKPGTLLIAAEKCQGLGKGGKIKRLGMIRVTAVRRERLDELLNNTGWGALGCKAEGFPDMTPSAFVAFFCLSHKGCTPSTEVTRIQFEYIDR
jgi:hypothetical protein